jgi:hypothetical protein
LGPFCLQELLAFAPTLSPFVYPAVAEKAMLSMHLGHKLVSGK